RLASESIKVSDMRSITTLEQITTRRQPAMRGVKRSPGSTSSSGRPRPDFFRAANDFCDRLVFLKTGESLPMKKCAITALVFCATSLTLLAASIDGKWTSETKFGERTIQNTFNLKSDGGALTGTMEMSAGGQSRSTDIKDGKIDGDKFKFTT